MSANAEDAADRAPTNPSEGSGAALRYDMRPSHALAGLAGISVIFALITDSTFGWILTAVAAATGAWYVSTRNIEWTPDIHDLLARYRFAVPRTISPTAPELSDRDEVVATQPIPFRPMTNTELFTGAQRVMIKNWPTLIGIPAGILLAFLAIFALSIVGVLSVVLGASSTLGGTTTVFTENPFSSTIVLFVGWMLVVMAMALPADALLLGLSVVATERAVRGESVRLAEVWKAARSRMFAVCRMTLTFYAISAAPSIVFVALLSLGGGLGSLFLVPFVSLGVFVLSILFSLSPIVLMIEGRGVVESLRRSVSLSRPAWGRLIGIHLLWAVSFVPLVLVMMVFGLNLLVYAVAAACMIAGFRVLQVLIYTDLRIRQEQYEHELIADWARNTGQG